MCNVRTGTPLAVEFRCHPHSNFPEISESLSLQVVRSGQAKTEDYPYQCPLACWGHTPHAAGRGETQRVLSTPHNVGARQIIAIAIYLTASCSPGCRSFGFWSRPTCGRTYAITLLGKGSTAPHISRGNRPTTESISIPGDSLTLTPPWCKSRSVAIAQVLLKSHCELGECRRGAAINPACSVVNVYGLRRDDTYLEFSAYPYI